MKPIFLVSGRQPFEVLLLAACVITAAMGLFMRGSGSATIDRFISGPWNLVFYVALGAAASVALLGVSLRPPHSLLVERIGLLFLAGLLLTYGIALYALYGLPVGASGSIIIAFGVAGAIRCGQISRDLRRLHFALRSSCDDAAGDA